MAEKKQSSSKKAPSSSKTSDGRSTEDKAKPKKAAPKKTAAKKQSAPASAKATAGKKKTSGDEVANKLRIRVRAYEHKVLDTSVKQIIDTAIRYDANLVGPIPLPTEIKKYTVNRSTFIYNNAREQYEMRVHKRLIDILNPSPKVIDALTNLSLPSGVNVDVKMV